MLHLSFLFAACTSTPAPTGPGPVDLVAVGHLHDGAGNRARPAAVLVDNGLIVAIEDDQSWRARVDDETTVIETTWITPGFVDAHAHPLGLGRRLSELDLVGAATYAETLARVAATKPGPSGWVTGRGWDQNDWTDAPEGGWPLADNLAPFGSEHPIALRRVDGHALWVNSVALTAAGITADTPDPVGGRILRHPDGRPTGVLIDTAMALVERPEPSRADVEQWLGTASQALVQSGLTGVHMMGADDDDIAIIEAANRAGTLPVRLWIYASPDSQAADKLATTGPWGSGNVHVVGVKAYADGALGSRGALLSSDYSDEPGHRGLPVTSATELNELAVRLLGAGSQLAVHAIGDAGVTTVLDAFEVARAAHPGKDNVRLRVEHAQIVHPSDTPRFAALNVVASMQPTHATSDMPWAPARLGEERVSWAYAWQTLARAGATLALGSDAPVEAIDPADGLWAATTRTDLAGTPSGGWTPAERLSVEQTVSGFTLGAAKAVHEEDRLGTIAVGRVGDLTLWSVTDGPGAQRWVPQATIIDGKAVWRAPQDTP